MSIPQTTESKLQELGIKKAVGDGGGCCKNKQKTYIYSLPIRLEDDVIPLIQAYGKLVFSFEKTSLLKIETKEFSIIGIRLMSQLRLTLKDLTRTDIVESLENTIIKYVTERRI